MVVFLVWFLLVVSCLSVQLASAALSSSGMVHFGTSGLCSAVMVIGLLISCFTGWLCTTEVWFCARRVMVLLIVSFLGGIAFHMGHNKDEHTRFLLVCWSDNMIAVTVGSGSVFLVA